jgi:Ni,Fe-hydrogenase I cytochrome b subunit
MATMGNRDMAAFPWVQAVGIVLLIVAGFYAAQHPNTLFYYIVKIIATP